MIDTGILKNILAQSNGLQIYLDEYINLDPKYIYQLCIDLDNNYTSY